MKFSNFSILILILLFMQVCLVDSRRRKKPKTRPKVTPTRRYPNKISGVTKRKPTTARWRNPVMINAVQRPIYKQYGRPIEDPPWTHCVITQKADSDWIKVQSDGYPDPVQKQQQCTWIFYVSKDQKIRISFNDIHLMNGNGGGNCNSQFVEIIDLQVMASQAKFCGDKIPGDYVSIGTRVRLDLQSDSTVYPYRGFQAAVRAEPATVASGSYSKSLIVWLGTSRAVTTTTTRRPLITRRVTTKRTIIRTRATSKSPVPLENQRQFFGPGHQPNLPNLSIQNTNYSALSSMEKLFLVVGTISFFLVLLALAVFFRKVLKEIYLEFRYPKKSKRRKRKRRKRRRALRAQQTESEEEDIKLELPMSYRRFNPSNEATSARRRSVTFEDEWIETDLEEEPLSDSNQSIDSKYSKSNFGKSKDPVYEMEDDEDEDWETSSAHSTDSVRTTSRHPSHKEFKKQKIYEKKLKINSNRSLDDGKETLKTNLNKNHSSSNPELFQSNLSEGEGLNRKKSLEAAILMKELLQNSNLISKISNPKNESPKIKRSNSESSLPKSS